jgi:predicted glycosyl hydrolase (DUF1957 family)
MLDGTPYERLIAVDGKNLTNAKQKEEQEKYQKAAAERQHESADQRSRRIAKYQAERKRDHTLIQQMISAFDYRLIGKRSLNGFRVYVLKATPRHGYKPIAWHSLSLSNVTRARSRRRPVVSPLRTLCQVPPPQGSLRFRRDESHGLPP